jgi:hypothetical protein
MCAQRPKGNSKENSRIVLGVIQKNSCTWLRILKEIVQIGKVSNYRKENMLTFIGVH